MPRIVAQSVKNWAMTNMVFAATSCSSLINKLVNESATAVRKEAVAIDFSNGRVIDDYGREKNSTPCERKVFSFVSHSKYSCDISHLKLLKSKVELLPEITPLSV